MLVQSLSGEEQVISPIKSSGIRSLQAWHYLIPILVVFWTLFAILLITNNILFFVVLATLAPLSCLVVCLAWAFQNNI